MTDNDYHGQLGQRVHRVSWLFWEDNKSTLLRHGQYWHDVRQQAWVEVLCLAKEWPTNPTKYLYGRLIDWLRKGSKWNRNRRQPAPFVQNFDYYEDLNNPKRGCNDHEWHPSASPVDHEAGEIIQRLRAYSQNQGGRSEKMVNAYIEGDTMEEIGRQHNVSESRVCQILGRVLRNFRPLVGAACVVLCLPLLVEAQTIQTIETCTELKWSANTEEDLAGYTIHIQKDGQAETAVNAGKPDTSITCEALGMTEGSTYSLYMTAFDTSGNIGEPSETLQVDWLLADTPPAPPLNVCLQVTVNNQPMELCTQP